MEELQNPAQLILFNQAEDRSYDFAPKTFQDYIGQEALKNKLRVYTQACKMREEALDHMLLFGSPGLGKTTLCQIMAQEMEVGIKLCSGPMIERTGDLVAILSSLNHKDILFIDEIHRMPKNVEEVLYSAMEVFKVDVIIGQGAGAKTVSLPIQPFTLIGATTKMGAVSAPLRSRFGIIEQLEFYNHDELMNVILQSAQFLQLNITPEGAKLLASCARGTPRIAKKLLRRIRDFAQVHNENNATYELIENSMKILGIDHDGCTKQDNELLKKILLNYRGGPVGLETLASLLGEDKDTIELMYEPFLMQQGFLEKTAKGRQIPPNKIPYLKKKFLGQESLFSQGV